MSDMLIDITGLLYITKTCPCNEYPLIPHFHIEKLGYAGYTHFSNLFQNIDCWYSLEQPRRGGTNVPHSILRAKEKKKERKERKITKRNSTENFQFLQLKKSLFIAWACFHNFKHRTR